jgi:hypothetical protein
MLRTRYLAWVALFEVFQELRPRELVAEREWDGLTFLIETLRDEKHLRDWSGIARTLDGIDGSRRISTPEAWRNLYDSLDNLWQKERMDYATQEELDAHAGAFTKFRLFS